MILPGLGRRISLDENDKKFLVRRRLAAAADVSLPRRKTWRIGGKSLDQGSTGTCVGHAWKNFLRCAPIRTEIGPTPWDIYRKAISVDEWTDNDAEIIDINNANLQSGTSVRAGAQTMIEFGRLKSYLWAFDLQSVIEWVLTQGPLVLGINWYSTFNNPDHEGIIKLSETSTILGGHAILCRGINLKTSLATLENSWGDTWGKSGACYIPLSTLERLIHEQGECCTAIETKILPIRTLPIP